MTTQQKGITKLLALLALMALAGAAHAEAWDGAAQGVQDAMYGPIGTTLAILGVAACGIAAFWGKMSFERAGMVVCGIVIFFAAPAIVNYVKGKLYSQNEGAPVYAMAESPKAHVPSSLIYG